MENKNLLVLWVAVAVLTVGLVWGVFLRERSVVVLDSKGNVVNTLGAISSALDMGRETGQNGLQTIVEKGDFVNATTTIVSIINPFPATSTVSFVGLFNSGVATTSYNINCGNRKAASAPNVSSNPTGIFTQVTNIASSSIFSQQFRTPTTTPTYLASGEYFQCVAHGVASNDAIDAESNAWYNAFTNANNTFDGSFWVEFMGVIK